MFNNFDAERWAQLEKNWMAWWNRDLGRPLLCGRSHKHNPDRVKPPWWRGGWWSIGDLPFPASPEEIAEENFKDLSEVTCHGDAWPRVWLNFGPGVAAGFLGARVDPKPETYWFYPGKWEGMPLKDIKPEFDPENPWWVAVREITRACVAKFGKDATFGFTDLGGNMDIAASLRDTQNLLMDCLDDPGEVDRICKDVTKCWLKFYDELHAIISPAGRGTTPWAPIWSPGRTYMLQSDFCYMISPEHFERWVLPDLAECCASLDHSFYHLDGKGELPHLDMLLGMDNLDGIQWVPGDGNPPFSAPEWRWLMKRIREAGKLVQQFGSVKEVLAFAKEFPLEGFIIEVFDHGGHTEAGIEAIQREAEDFRKKQKPVVSV